jgi:hypothetical protein
MPNVGIRGTVWQEIEGKKRKTAARMFAPLFLEADLKGLMMRLVGEFRWDMCKRIQGIRWNDITSPSLTSEYSDFLQFYKNSKELSIEAREDIKLELIRARNIYKNVFVANYAEWIQYESNGSPRLNKVALRLMITYCPFSPEIQTNLAQHPRYTELLARQKHIKKKRVQQLNNLIQRCRRNGYAVPQEILDELEFAEW